MFIYAKVQNMQLEDLGVIGNCQFSALVHTSGEIVWCCLPRFDSEPACSTLLDSKDGPLVLQGSNHVRFEGFRFLAARILRIHL